MFRILFSPTWFYGLDSVFELVSLFVSFLIFVYALRLYRFSGEKKYKFFSFSFLSITLAYIFKIIFSYIMM